MPDYRKYYSNREIIKLDLVQNEDYTDNVILCVPKFAYDVARSMLAHYGKFRTSYAASYGELFYELPDDSLFDTIEASIDLFLGSRDMSCDIVAALECICDQFALQVAATNELVAATYTSSVSANYAGNPEQTAGESGGSIPVGASAPDTGITDRKCKAAHYIVDNINYMMFGLLTNPPPDWYDIGDTDNYLRQLGDTSSFGSLLTAIYGSYQSLASAIFGGDIDYEAIYDDIVANYEDLVCALYSADSATEARSNFLFALTVTGDEYSFVSDFMYNNILNVLWFGVSDSETQLASWTTTVDCGATCSIEYGYWVSLGTELVEPLAEIQTVPLGFSNRYDLRVNFNWRYPPGEYAIPDGVTINSITIVSGSPSRTSGSMYLAYSTTGLIYQHASIPPSNLSNVSLLEIVTNNGASAVFDIDWTL